MASVIEELVALLGYEIEGEENLRKWENSLDSLQNKALALGSALFTMAAAAGAAVAGGMSALGKGVIDTTAKFEMYAATLETIEGSADKAQKALTWITDFAKTTPFEVDELTASFVKLRSYGMDPMNGIMNTIGDTASGMGKSLDQVVEAVADASTFQFERLRELGIVANQAKGEVTFAWTEGGKQMKKTIKKDSEEILKFLTETWNRKFAGGMIRQSKTWNGMISNLSDTWTAFMLRIGKAGFFDVAKDKLAGFMEQLSEWDRDGTSEAIAKFLSVSLTNSLNMVGAVLDRLSNHLRFFMRNWDTLVPWIRGIMYGLAAAAAIAMPGLTGIVLLAFAIDDFLTYLEGGSSVIGRFIDKLRELLPVSEEVKDAVIRIGGAIAAGLLVALALAPRVIIGGILRLVATILATLATSLIAGMSAVVTPILGAFSSLGTILLAGLRIAFGVMSGPVGWAILAASAAALIYTFWDEIVAGWDQLSAWAGSLFSTIGSWFDGIDWGGIASSLWSNFTSSVGAAWSGLVAWATPYFEAIGTAIDGIDWLGVGQNIGYTLMSSFIGMIAKSVSFVVDTFKLAWDGIKGIDWVGLAFSIAETIVNGVKNIIPGIRNIMMQVGDAIRNTDWAAVMQAVIDIWLATMGALPTLMLGIFSGMAQAVSDEIKKWFDVDLYAIGQQLLNRLWAGMKSVGGQIKEYFKSLFDFQIPGFSTPPVPANSNSPVDNFQGNMDRIDGAPGKAGVVQDNSNRSVTTNVDAPVNVTVQQASQAPAAVGNAISGAVNRGAQPARINGGGGF